MTPVELDGPPPGRFAAGPQWFRDARRLDWSKLMWHAALHAVPVPAVALVAGLWVGKPFESMVIVGAAVTAGFGAFHQLTRWRLVPMVVATAGFGVSAWVGAVLGRHDLASALVTAGVWGAVFGALTALGQGAWWVGLQCVIALCVSGAYPAGLAASTRRVGLVLAAGAVQIGVTAVIWWWRREPFTYVQTLEPFELNLRPTRWGFRFPLDDAGLRYAARVTAVMVTAALVQHVLWRWQNGYWVPMTAAMVLKIDLPTTFTRGVARLGGTAVGAIGVTLLAQLLRPPPLVLAAVIVLALAAAFTVQKVNYGLFASCITAYVVCLLALGKLPVPGVAERRAAATLIGGAIALGSFVVFPPGRAATGT